MEVSHLAYRGFKQQGIIGKCVDPLTGRTGLLHQLSHHELKVVMQGFELPRAMAAEKCRQISRSVTQHVCCNYVPPLCHSLRRLSKDLSQLNIYYCTHGLLGESLQSRISTLRERNQPMPQSEARTMLREVLECVWLVGRFTNEYLGLSPFNIFYQEKGHRRFHVTNFGLDFADSKWQRKYGDPQDRAFCLAPDKRTSQDLLSGCVFVLGQTALQALTLASSQSLYSATGSLDRAELQARLAAYKGSLKALLTGMVAPERQRLKLSDLLKHEELEWETQFQLKREGCLSVKCRGNQGDPKGYGEIMLVESSAFKGYMENWQKEGFGLLREVNLFRIGFFQGGKTSLESRIYKDEGVWLGNSETLVGLFIFLNNQKSICLEGQFQQQKGKLRLVKGKSTFSTGWHKGEWREGLLEGRGVLVNFKNRSRDYGRWVGGLLAGKGLRLEQQQWYQMDWQEGLQKGRVVLRKSPSLAEFDEFAA